MADLEKKLSLLEQYQKIDNEAIRRHEKVLREFFDHYFRYPYSEKWKEKLNEKMENEFPITQKQFIHEIEVHDKLLKKEFWEKIESMRIQFRDKEDYSHVSLMDELWDYQRELKKGKK